MAITYNGNNINNVTYNGNQLNKVTYNGNTVWEKSTPTPTGTYKKIVDDGSGYKILYLRGTPAEGYTEYNVASGPAYITGDMSTNKLVKTVVVESPCLLPANCKIMFFQCSHLTSLDLSKFNTSNVTDMSSMFSSCLKLTSLDLSKFNTSNVTNMSYMFSQCSQLTSLDLSNFNTSNVTNMQWMFDNNELLQHIYVGDNWNTDAVTDSNCMFLNNTNLHNFNSSYTDKTKAIIDDGSNGGYLERKS